MKKILSLCAIATATLAFAACSNENKTEAEQAAENQEAVDQEVVEDLQNGTPVEVDVEGAQVIDQPNGTQEVQTEVAVTPETAE